MKKKIYFTISAILQILASFYILINASSIIQEQINTIKEAYAAFPVDFQSRILTMLQNNGPTFLIIMSSIAIILNALVLYTAIRGNVLKKKEKFIAFSIVCLFTTESTIVTLLSIVNFIVLLCLKRKNEDDYPEPKQEIPTVKYQKSTKKEIIMSIIFVVLYFSQFFINRFIPNDLSFVTAIIMTILIYIILFALAIIAFKDRLKRDIKLFKENAKAYYQFILPKLGIMYVIFIISNLICVMISRKSNFNKPRNT